MSRNEINAQGAGLGRAGIEVPEASPRSSSLSSSSTSSTSFVPAGNERKRCIATSRRSKENRENARAIERPFRPCLRALGRVLSLAYSGARAHARAAALPLVYPDRNSFHPFPPHPPARRLFAPLQNYVLSRTILFFSLLSLLSLSLSICIYLRHPRRFVFPAPGPATFHLAIMHKTGVRASTSVLTPGKRFVDVPT